jgi:predicted transcriptional regulator
MSTIDISDAVMEKLERMAATTLRSKDQLVTEALEHYLSYKAYAISRIEQGLAEAERGEFASEEDLDNLEASLMARIQDCA